MSPAERSAIRRSSLRDPESRRTSPAAERAASRRTSPLSPMSDGKNTSAERDQASRKIGTSRRPTLRSTSNAVRATSAFALMMARSEVLSKEAFHQHYLTTDYFYNYFLLSLNEVSSLPSSVSKYADSLSDDLSKVLTLVLTLVRSPYRPLHRSIPSNSMTEDTPAPLPATPGSTAGSTSAGSTAVGEKLTFSQRRQRRQGGRPRLLATANALKFTSAFITRSSGKYC
eukprot:sb/3469556/